MSTYHHSIDGPHSHTHDRLSTHHFGPGQILGGLLGVFLTVVGIVVVTRNGIDGSLNQPVTDVLGITQSSYVGLASILFGLLTLAGATMRGLMGFMGALMVVGGVILAAGSAKILLDVGAKTSTGWYFIILGAVAILADLMPVMTRSERVTETSVE
jgi:hypothetical protein